MGRGGEQPLPTKNWKSLAPLRHGKEQMCSPYPAEVLAQLKQNKHSNLKLPDVKVRIKTPAKISIPLPQIPDESLGYRTFPLDRTALLPRVQWRDASEYIKGAQEGSKMPLCTWLGV